MCKEYSSANGRSCAGLSTLLSLRDFFAPEGLAEPEKEQAAVFRLK